MIDIEDFWPPPLFEALVDEDFEAEPTAARVESVHQVPTKPKTAHRRLAARASYRRSFEERFLRDFDREVARRVRARLLSMRRRLLSEVK